MRKESKHANERWQMTSLYEIMNSPEYERAKTAMMKNGIQHIKAIAPHWRYMRMKGRSTTLLSLGVVVSRVAI